MSEPIGPSTFFCPSTSKIDATRVSATLCIAFLPSLKYGFIRARFLIPGALFHACNQTMPFKPMLSTVQRFRKMHDGVTSSCHSINFQLHLSWVNDTITVCGCQWVPRDLRIKCRKQTAWYCKTTVSVPYLDVFFLFIYFFFCAGDFIYQNFKHLFKNPRNTSRNTQWRKFKVIYH